MLYVLVYVAMLHVSIWSSRLIGWSFQTKFVNYKIYLCHAVESIRFRILWNTNDLSKNNQSVKLNIYYFVPFELIIKMTRFYSKKEQFGRKRSHSLNMANYCRILGSSDCLALENSWFFLFCKFCWPERWRIKLPECKSVCFKYIYL